MENTIYNELTTKMLKVLKDVDNDSMILAKARVLIKISNTLINIERARIQSNKIVGKAN